MIEWEDRDTGFCVSRVQWYLRNLVKNIRAPGPASQGHRNPFLKGFSEDADVKLGLVTTELNIQLGALYLFCPANARNLSISMKLLWKLSANWLLLTFFQFLICFRFCYCIDLHTYFMVF